MQNNGIPGPWNNTIETSTSPDVANGWNYRFWDSFWNTDFGDFLQKNWNKCPNEDGCGGWVSSKETLQNGSDRVICDSCGFVYIRQGPQNYGQNPYTAQD